MAAISSDESSGDDSEENSEKDSEEEPDCRSDDSGEAEIAALKAVLKDKARTRAKPQGREKEVNGVGKGGGSKGSRGEERAAVSPAAGKGRGLRSAVSLPLRNSLFASIAVDGIGLR